MRRLILLPIVTVALGLGGCASVEPPARKAVATALLLDTEGRPAGNATLFAIGDRYDLRLEVRNMSPGPHGAHLHAVGRCEPRDFASAGGHLNPSSRQHGSLNPQGSHLGDLPNIEVDARGSGASDQLLAGSRPQIEKDLFDADGTAVVIHAGADDYRTDPSGSSGGRIACGVFTRIR